MSVEFRNVDVAADLLVDRWPFEAIVTVVERGSITDWARLTRSVRSDPWGPVARQIEEVLSFERPPGVTGLLERALASAREEAQESERVAVASEVDDLIRRSGLGATDFAQRIGTSASRLSTYRRGRVTPSASLMVRMRRVAIDSTDATS